jgi:hypothetical protein
MAFFAEIDITNRVLRVVVACDQDVLNNGGHGSQQAADHFTKVCPLSEDGVKWIETFKDKSQRKRFAAINGYYDLGRDAFIYQQPYPSWSLDETGEWKAPIEKPSIDNEKPISEGNTYLVMNLNWDENNQKWRCQDRDNNQYEWISSSKSWLKIN